MTEDKLVILDYIRSLGEDVDLVSNFLIQVSLTERFLLYVREKYGEEVLFNFSIKKHVFSFVGKTIVYRGEYEEFIYYAMDLLKFGIIILCDTKSYVITAKGEAMVRAVTGQNVPIPTSVWGYYDPLSSSFNNSWHLRDLQKKSRKSKGEDCFFSRDDFDKIVEGAHPLSKIRIRENVMCSTCKSSEKHYCDKVKKNKGIPTTQDFPGCSRHSDLNKD